MKWFRRIFGTPTRDELAHLLIDTHRRAGFEAIQYDPESFQLRLQGEDGKPVLKNLHNAYAAYAAARPWQRGTILRRFSASPWLFPPAATWEEAVPRLRPGLRDAYMFETLRLQARLESDPGQEKLDYAQRTFAGGVCVTLLEDHHEHMASVSSESLQTWGVSFDEALATALANLEAVSAPRRWTSPFPGVYGSAWQDDYDASRLLLPDILAGLELRGVPIALLPNRNCLIVTGSEDDDAVGQVLAYAESQMEAPGALSVLPLRQTPSGWAPWEIADNHPSRETFRRLRLKEMGGIYEDQKRLIDAIHEKEKTDIFVGSFSAFENQETGHVRSYTTWTWGVLSLLPRTDLIGFYDPRLPEGQKIRGLFDWEKVEAVCGQLMKVTDDIPPRYLIEQDVFPTDKDFAAMGPPAA